MSSPGLRSSLGYGTGRGYKKGSTDGGGDSPVSAKCPTKSGPPGLGIRETPRELRRISTLSGPSRPTKSNPKALLMSDSGIVPKIFAVAPRHRGTPSARRLWVVSPSARRPEGPRPARSFRIQQKRLRFFSCESIRTLDRKFPSVRAVIRGFPPSTSAM